MLNIGKFEPKRQFIFNNKKIIVSRLDNLTRSKILFLKLNPLNWSPRELKILV